MYRNIIQKHYLQARTMRQNHFTNPNNFNKVNAEKLRNFVNIDPGDEDDDYYDDHQYYGEEVDESKLLNSIKIKLQMKRHMVA